MTNMPYDFFSFYVTNVGQVVVWCISDIPSYYNHTNSSCKSQGSVTER